MVNTYYILMCNTHSAKCKNPVVQINGSIAVIGYTDPALKGTTLTVNCYLGLVLTGPNTTTCMDNGQWEPDLKEVECKGVHTYSELLYSAACYLIYTTHCMCICLAQWYWKSKWLLFRQPDDYPRVRFQGKRNRVWVLENFKGSLRVLVGG